MHEGQTAKWFAVRASGSHGVADVVWIRPRANKCADPNHFEVKFIQVKVSEHLKAYKEEIKAQETPFGLANIEFRYFPVRARRGAK